MLSLLHDFEEKTYIKNSYVYKKNDDVEYFYFIKEGEIKL